MVVQANGALAPGYAAGAGTLNANSLLLNPSTALNYNLTPGSSGYVNVAGNLNLSFATPNSVTVNLSGNGVTAGTYALIGYNSWTPGNAGTGAFEIGSKPSSVAGDSFSFTTSGNFIDLVIAAASGPANGTWIHTSGGSWSTGTNWDIGAAPGNPQDTAVFGPAVTGGTAQVTLDGSRSLASLGFNNTAASYQISASNGATLTLANTGGLPATLSNSGGSHTIAAPIVLGSNLNVTASPGSALSIAGSINESSPNTSLSVSGGGALILSGTSDYSGGTTVNAGALAVTAASALPSSGLVTIGGGGRLVLGGGSGIGTMLTASLPVGSGAVALSAASIPATIAPMENSVENMATLGGVPHCRKPVGEAPSAVPPPPCPSRGPSLLAAGVLLLAIARWRRRG